MKVDHNHLVYNITFFTIVDMIFLLVASDKNALMTLEHCSKALEDVFEAIFFLWRQPKSPPLVYAKVNNLQKII